MGVDDTTPEGKKKVEEGLADANRHLEQQRQQEQGQDFQIPEPVMYALRALVFLALIAIVAAFFRWSKRKKTAGDAAPTNPEQKDPADAP